jgi:putative N-acetyltransferase (TIGR04045 family)
VAGTSSRSTVAADALGTTCRVARCDEDLEAHFWLRRSVFVYEQGLFAGDDRDERDDAPSTLHAVGLVDGEPCGAVRLYPLDPAGLEWKGDRLAVHADHRTHHLGAELVRFAVATAGWLGGRGMIAHVQLPNVRFFEHLGWEVHGDPFQFHDVAHQPMSIPLRNPEAG